MEFTSSTMDRINEAMTITCQMWAEMGEDPFTQANLDELLSELQVIGQELPEASPRDLACHALFQQY